MRFTVKPNVNVAKATSAAAQQYQRDLRAAAIIATDRASKEAQRGVQERIRSTGLGRLANAVGHTSTRLEKKGGNPYGVIFAKGGDESLAGGALESYSRGSTIRPGPGKSWLWIPTEVVPRFIQIGGKRRRLTPELYQRSSLVQRIGKLEFRPISASRALFVVKKVSLSPKTGQAKALGPRGTRTRVPKKEAVAFVGIRVTRRAARFNKDGVVSFYSRRVPQYMQEALADMAKKRA